MLHLFVLLPNPRHTHACINECIHDYLKLEVVREFQAVHFYKNITNLNLPASLSRESRGETTHRCLFTAVAALCKLQQKQEKSASANSASACMVQLSLSFSHFPGLSALSVSHSLSLFLLESVSLSPPLSLSLSLSLSPPPPLSAVLSLSCALSVYFVSSGKLAKHTHMPTPPTLVTALARAAGAVLGQLLAVDAAMCSGCGGVGAGSSSAGGVPAV
jgi:hypothetical protein